MNTFKLRVKETLEHKDPQDLAMLFAIGCLGLNLVFLMLFFLDFLIHTFAH